jgi:hypothetical protein
VVPVAPEKLVWVYMNEVGDKWVPIDNDSAAKVQFVGYGVPLTKEQLKKLEISYGEPFLHREQSHKEAQYGGTKRWMCHTGTRAN